MAELTHGHCVYRKRKHVVHLLKLYLAFMEVNYGGLHLREGARQTSQHISG
jgi:hypothetical protein